MRSLPQSVTSLNPVLPAELLGELQSALLEPSAAVF